MLRAPLVRFPRSWPWPVRTAGALAWVARLARQHDVVYATGLDLAAVAGAGLARRPVALKVVGDPAWERGVPSGSHLPVVRRLPGRPGRPTRAPRHARPAELVGPERHGAALPEPAPRGTCRSLGASERRAGRPERRRARSPPHDASERARSPPTGVRRTAGRAQASRPDHRCGRGERTRRHLDVVGDGPEEQAWRALADRLGVAERVRFEGALDPRPDLGAHRRCRRAGAGERVRGSPARGARGARVRDPRDHHCTPRPRRRAHRRRRLAARRRRTARR